MKKSSTLLATATLAATFLLGCPGPPGPEGPQGPPGPAGTAIAFYVVDGASTAVASSAADTQTVSCASGDAATGWTTDGSGLVAGPGVTGSRNVVPVLTGTRPTGFTFTFFCTTAPTCQIQHRVVCADLTP